MTKPLIGVTISKATPWWVYPFFAFAIARSGGKAVKWSDAGRLDVDRVDGVVIGAGEAYSLRLSDTGLAVTTTTQTARDVLDRWALEVAFADAKPILAVGFGVQRLNAALGGASSEAVPDQTDYRPRRRTFVERRIKPLSNSRLAKAIGTSPIAVRAFGTSEIGTLGVGMHIAARDEEGAIQAIERARVPFALGVQWRPELAVGDVRMHGVFRALVAAARERAFDRQTSHSPRRREKNGTAMEPRASQAVT